MLHARELADRIDLTTGAKTCIFNPDGVFGIRSPYWRRCEQDFGGVVEV